MPLVPTLLSRLGVRLCLGLELLRRFSSNTAGNTSRTLRSSAARNRKLGEPGARFTAISTFPVARASFQQPKKLTKFGYHLASGVYYSVRRFIRDTEIAFWHDDLPASLREVRELRLKLMHPDVIEGSCLSSPRRTWRIEGRAGCEHDQWAIPKVPCGAHLGCVFLECTSCCRRQRCGLIREHLQPQPLIRSDTLRRWSWVQSGILREKSD